MLIGTIAIRPLPLTVAARIPRLLERNAVAVFGSWGTEFIGPEFECRVDAGAVVPVEFCRVLVFYDVCLFVVKPVGTRRQG